MDSPKFQVFKSIINHRYSLRLKASTGEVILGSDGYETREAYLSAILSIRSSAVYDSRYQRSDDHTFTFSLKACNGKIIAHSECFHSRLSREKVIETIKASAANALVEEL